MEAHLQQDVSFFYTEYHDDTKNRRRNIKNNANVFHQSKSFCCTHSLNSRRYGSRRACHHNCTIWSRAWQGGVWDAGHRQRANDEPVSGEFDDGCSGGSCAYDEQCTGVIGKHRCVVACCYRYFVVNTFNIYPFGDTLWHESNWRWNKFLSTHTF